MRTCLLFLVFLFPLVVGASPIRHYQLDGFINGPVNAEGSTKLKDVKFGSTFKLNMSVQLNDEQQLTMFVAGAIGSWSFYPDSAYGYYYLGDGSPERLGMELGGAGNPQGEDCIVSEFWAQLIFFGFGGSTGTDVPYEEWLLKDDGYLDPRWFKSGQLNLFYSAELPSGEIQARTLSGAVTSLYQVPETNSLALFGLAMSLIGYRTYRKETIKK